MAIKIKRRKPEDLAADALEQPDQVLAATQETFGWLQDNRNLVLGGIGGLIAVIVVASLVWDARGQSRVASAAPVVSALGLAGAPVGEDGQFGTLTERAEATLAALDGAEPPLAQVISAGANLRLGDAAAAAAALDAASAAVGAPEQAALAFGRAAAQAESGNLDAALATLDAVASANAALAALAALQSARLIDAYGTDEAALAAYREYLDAHTEAPGVSAVRNRVEQIEIALGIAPPADEDESGDEG